MIKARGDLLSHVHSARGALQQLKQRPSSLAPTPPPPPTEYSPPFPSPPVSSGSSISPVKGPSQGRVFRGFLFGFSRNNPALWSRSFHDRWLQDGPKHSSIVALWNFEPRNPNFDSAARLRKSKCLHTSTKGRLTTSELIKKLRSGNRTDAETSTTCKALETENGVVKKQIKRSLVDGEEVYESTHIKSLPELKPTEKPDKESTETTIDDSTIKMPLSKLIPRHVATRGILKKESFSESQTMRIKSSRFDSRGHGSENLKVNQNKAPHQRHSLPVLQMRSTQMDVSDEGFEKVGGFSAANSRRVSFSRGVNETKSHGQVRSRGSTERQFQQHTTIMEVAGRQPFQERSDLKTQFQEHQVSAGFAGESSEIVGTQPIGRRRGSEAQLQQHGEIVEVACRQPFYGGRFTERQFQQHWKSTKVVGRNPIVIPSQHHRESTEVTGRGTTETTNRVSGESVGRQPVDMIRGIKTPFQQHRESMEVDGRQPFDRRRVTETQFPQYRESTELAGESGEVFGRQPFDKRMATGPQFQEHRNSTEFAGRQPFDRRMATETQFQGHRESPEFTDRKPFDRRASERQFQQQGESTVVAGRKPFDRNRPKKRGKNELKEMDLSLQPIAGEPHYEYLIRRKRVRAEAQKALKDDVEDYEHVGDDWIRKRLGWLCKEIPVLKASGLVKMLNNQKKWIKQEHMVELVEHLVRLMELNRAHRALKWMQQQPFYRFEYELHNNMAYILGRNNKLSRCQDVFDEIVRNGRFPDGSVFTALIKAYLHKGDQGDIDDAWKLYNQMLQLGLTPSSSLLETLLKSLTCPTGRWLRQAEELLTKMKAAGHYINEEIYTHVIEIHGKRGDHKKVDALVGEMKEEGLETDISVLNAVLAACVKDGDIKKAEYTLREMIELGLKPNWRSYAYLIQVCGKANLPMRSWQIFEKMKGEKIPVNIVTYHAIIDVMAADGLHTEEVLQLLTEVEKSGLKPLQPCFNSVMNMYLKLKMHEEVESIFNRGKAAKARPAHAAYNMLIKAYTDSGQLEKAETVFQEMKKTEGMGPNTHTYNLMLEGYGVGCFKGRVKEIFEEMLAKGCQIDPDVKVHIQSMVGAKRLVQLEKQKLKLTDEQREIIPGLLLGGAKMESPDRNRTYELHLEFNCQNKVGRMVKDHLAFLFQAWWKQNQPPTPSEGEESLVEGSSTKSLTQLETVSHGSFRFYAHQYRPDGDPVIPKLIHRWLRPRTLAYWYMYGGRKCQTTGGIVLNASKYSGKQIQLVVKALKARTMDCRRKKKRNGDVIRFEGKSAVWLWKLMEPYILKALREQLKPEEVPVNLAAAESDELWESHDGASSDEDDWEDLVAEKHEELVCS